MWAVWTLLAGAGVVVIGIMAYCLYLTWRMHRNLP